MIKDMRWGYDGGGMACGPVEGSVNVEIKYLNDDRQLQFMLISNFQCFYKVQISDVSLFDLSMSAGDRDVDFDFELGLMEKLSKNTFDFEEGEEPDELKNSDVYNLYKVGLLAVREYWDINDENEAMAAEDFIEEYTDCDVRKLEIDLDDEFDEDDDDEWSDEEMEIIEELEEKGILMRSYRIASTGRKNSDPLIGECNVLEMKLKDNRRNVFLTIYHSSATDALVVECTNASIFDLMLVPDEKWNEKKEKEFHLKCEDKAEYKPDYDFFRDFAIKELKKFSKK